MTDTQINAFVEEAALEAAYDAGLSYAIAILEEEATEATGGTLAVLTEIIDELRSELEEVQG